MLSVVSDLAARASKSSSTTRGMTPHFSGATATVAVASPASPLPMVYVLPLPVWPYAKTVALYPFMQPATSGAHASS